MAKKTKIYTIFATPGYDPLRLYYKRSVVGSDGTRIPKSFLSNEELVHKLEKGCQAVQFITRALEQDFSYGVEQPTEDDKLLEEIEELKGVLDGVLIVGNYLKNRFGITGTEQQPLAFTGLSTIVVQNL